MRQKTYSDWAERFIEEPEMKRVGTQNDARYPDTAEHRAACASARAPWLRRAAFSAGRTLLAFAAMAIPWPHMVLIGAIVGAFFLVEVMISLERAITAPFD